MNQESMNHVIVSWKCVIQRFVHQRCVNQECVCWVYQIYVYPQVQQNSVFKCEPGVCLPAMCATEGVHVLGMHVPNVCALEMCIRTYINQCVWNKAVLQWCVLPSSFLHLLVSEKKISQYMFISWLVSFEYYSYTIFSCSLVWNFLISPEYLTNPYLWGFNWPDMLYSHINWSTKTLSDMLDFWFV